MEISSKGMSCDEHLILGTVADFILIQAAMSLQKNFPKERKFYFWAIFLSYLLGSDKGSSDMDRKLFGTLAYRMMSKAAADVPADPVCYAQLGCHPLFSGCSYLNDLTNFFCVPFSPNY